MSRLGSLGVDTHRALFVALAILAATFVLPAAQAQLTIAGAPAVTQEDGPCAETNDRYVDCGNGTITDTVTGLIWLKRADCEELQTPFSPTADYASALVAATRLEDGLCGLSDGSEPGDWRLPTIDEWQVTVARAVALGCDFNNMGMHPTLTNTPGTACNKTGPNPFSGAIANSYWSGTVDDLDPDHAWVQELLLGAKASEFKTAVRGLWPVRTDR